MGPRAGVSCGAFRPHFWPFGAQMNILVLGAGLQGCAAAYDLLQVPSVTRVTLADLNPARLPKFLQKDWGSRLKPLTLDVKDPAAVAQAMAGQNAVLCALPYYFNEPMTRAAVEAGAHFCDLGGNTEIVLQQRQLDAQAKAKGVSVIPDCGLAPGMVNILAAEGIRRLDKADRVKIFVGGLPQKPEPPPQLPDRLFARRGARLLHHAVTGPAGGEEARGRRPERAGRCPVPDPDRHPRGVPHRRWDFDPSDDLGGEGRRDGV